MEDWEKEWNKMVNSNEETNDISSSFFQEDDSNPIGEYAQLNVRADKSLDSNVISKLNNNTKIDVLDNSDPDWCKVSLNGKTGYVRKEYIDLSNEGTTGVVTTPELNFKDYREENWVNSLTRLKDKTLKGELTEDVYYQMLDELQNNPEGPSSKLIDQARRSYDEYKELGEFTVGDPITKVDNDVKIVKPSNKGIAGIISGIGTATTSAIANVANTISSLGSSVVTSTNLSERGFSSTLNDYLSLDDNQKLINRAKYIQDLNSSVKDRISIATINLEGLNSLTLEKLPSTLNDFYNYCLSNGIVKVNDAAAEVITLLTKANNDLQEIDTGKDNTDRPTGRTYHYSDYSSETSEQEQTNEEETEFQQQEETKTENDKLINVALGVFTFQTPVAIYTSIGGEQLQTSSETTYGMLGLEKVDDIFYYKIIDKTTGKIYYVKADDVNLTENENIEVISVIDNAIILSSTDIGADDNFVKLANPNSYYFVTDKQEINGINFATILDPEDGSKYYVPVSESVKLLPLSEAIKPDMGGSIIGDEDISIVIEEDNSSNNDLSQDTINDSISIENGDNNQDIDTDYGVIVDDLEVNENPDNGSLEQKEISDSDVAASDDWEALNE